MQQDLQGSVTKDLASHLQSHHIPCPRLVARKSQMAGEPARAEAVVQKFPCQQQLTFGLF